jgi:hypothetical protein
MATFAKTPPGDARGLGLVPIDRNDFDRGAVEQQIEFATAGIALAAFNDDRGFEQARG